MEEEQKERVEFRDFDDEEIKYVDFEEGDYIEAPIDKLGPPGRWIRHRLLASSLYGTPLLCTIQRHRTPFRTKLMKATSFFGTEEFYIILNCFITWLIDARLGRLLCILMGIGFFVSNFLKTCFDITRVSSSVYVIEYIYKDYYRNCLCLPRPPCPPVVPLEQASETWGLPSHHSVLCVILPWYIWFYSLIHFNMGNLEMSVLFSCITLWCFSVLLCRVYLGVHSPADVVSGSICGCLILSFWLKIDNFLDHYISSGNNVIMQALVFTIAFLFIHPRPRYKTGSFTETVCMLGTVVGFIIARSAWTVRKPALCKTIFKEYTELTSWQSILVVSISRLLLGFLVILCVRAIAKVVFGYIVFSIYNLLGFKTADKSSNKCSYFNTTYTKSFKLPPIFSKDDESRKPKSNKISTVAETWEVDYPTKYVTYIFIGWSGSYLVPYLFHLLSLNI